MIIDLHVHSSISPCSRLGIDEILEHARELGLDGVCITDHDTMDARHEVSEGLQPDGLLLLVGMEYATEQGDYLIFGPFEGLEPGLPATEMLRRVREAGGAAVVAHPCRRKRPADPTLAAEGLLTAVERVNGRNSPAENAQAAGWERDFADHDLNGVSGSDAHSLAELGRAPTRFLMPVRNRSELIEALDKGLCEPAYPAPLKSEARAPRSGHTPVSSPQPCPALQAKSH